MIELYPHQDDFIYSDAVHTGLVAGYGAGKSYAGIFKTIKKKLEYPNISVAYYLPTYSLIKQVAFVGFQKLLIEHSIPYTLNKTDKDIDTPYGRIILRSMDDPSLIIGYEVGYSIIDEADVLSTDKMHDVFIRALGRNRIKLPDGKPNSFDFVSTPEGFKFLYKFFVKNKNKNRVLITANTRDNKHLSDFYIETLLESYTPEEARAYLDGEFVNLTTGTVYRNYDRQDNNSSRVLKDTDVLHIGMDFNITNMNAVIHVIDRIPIAIEEISKAYDTKQMIELIQARYSKHAIVIYPDASGKARSTSGKSDIVLLKEARFTIRQMNSNPLVRDRVNALNVALLNNKGQRNYLINRDNCPVYVEALEQQYYKNGVPDKQSGFDHITEAGGYFIYQHTRKRFNRMKASV